MSKEQLFQPDREMVHCQLVDGAAQFSTFISADCDSGLQDAIEKWADGERVSIEVRFTLDGAVKERIESYCDASEGRHVLDADDRPMFDSIRAQLVAALALIDGIEWEGEPKATP